MSEPQNGGRTAQRERQRGREDDGRRGRSLPHEDLVESATKQLSRLTGKQAEFVSALVRTDEGWRATVEVLEVERVPTYTSLMGTYEVDVDDDGRLIGYERIRRYRRGQADE